VSHFFNFWESNYV